MTKKTPTRPELYILLSGLSKDSLKKFGKFVNSPYFNSNSKAAELFEAIREFYPGFENGGLSKRNLYERIYGKGKFVEGTINYLISELQSLLERFLALENTDREVLDISFLRYLLRNSHEHMFIKNYPSARKRIAVRGIPLYDYLLTDLYSEYIDKKKDVLTKKDAYRKEWFEPTGKLVNFFLDRLITEIIMIANYQRTSNTEIKVPLFDEVMKFLENSPEYVKDPHAQLNFRLLRVLMHYDEESYRIVRSLLRKLGKELSDTKKSEAINALHIYCINKLINGENLYREEFENVKLRFAIMNYSKEKPVDIDVFFHSFILAVSNGEFEWAQSLVNKFAKFLPEHFQNNAIHYSNARLLYQKKQFERALSELSRIGSYSFIHYKPAVKILQMMIYYDMKLFPEAGDAANAFIQFLRQDKLITADRKKTYFDFAKFFISFNNATATGKSERIHSVRLRLEKNKGFLIARNWFSQRL